MKTKILSALLVVLISIATTMAQTKETRDVSTFSKISFRVSGKLYLKQGSPQKVEIEGKKDILEEIETEVDGGRLVIKKKGNGWMDWNWGDNDDKVNVYVTVKDIEALSVSGSGDLIVQGKINASDLDLNVSGSGSLQLEAAVSGNLEADVSGSGEILLKGSCKNYDSDISGSGRIEIEVAISETASFGVSGSGKIQASGSAREVKTNISGAGKVLAANLETTKCEVRISGSGDVEINVKDELDANISGSGSVSYKGNPNHVNSHASGSGHIRKM